MTKPKLKGRELPDYTRCDNAREHTPCPPDHVGWYQWAEKKSKTHKQVRCPSCQRWAIWVFKKKRKPKMKPPDLIPGLGPVRVELPDPFQQLLTALPSYPGVKQVSIYSLPVPKFPRPPPPKPKKRKR